jgi:hypothetical protein
VEQNDGTLQMQDILLPLTSISGDERLAQLGFITEPEGQSLRVSDIAFMSPAEMAGLEPGFTQSISGYYLPLKQPANGWFLLPPLLLLIAMLLLQWRRSERKQD